MKLPEHALSKTYKSNSMHSYQKQVMIVLNIIITYRYFVILLKNTFNILIEIVNSMGSVIS